MFPFGMSSFDRQHDHEDSPRGARGPPMPFGMSRQRFSDIQSGHVIRDDYDSAEEDKNFSDEDRSDEDEDDGDVQDPELIAALVSELSIADGPRVPKRVGTKHKVDYNNLWRMFKENPTRELLEIFFNYDPRRGDWKWTPRRMSPQNFEELLEKRRLLKRSIDEQLDLRRGRQSERQRQLEATLSSAPSDVIRLMLKYLDRNRN